MAQVATISRTSDLSGAPATETVELALDGRRVQIDLTEEELAELTEFVAPYLEKGAVVRAPRGARTQRSPRQARDLGSIRAWAAEQGIQLSARGRVPHSVLDAYAAAH